MRASGPIPPGFAADDDGMLLIGGRRADALVEEAGGTPLFVYDRALVEAKVRQFRDSMPSEVALHYAVKANPFGPLLQSLSQRVDGFDLASAGELRRLEAAGVTDLPMSFAGPGKSDEELAVALAAGVTVNVESEGELERLLALAGRTGARPRIAVRVNPPFGLKGSGMKMGGLASPFGIDHDRAAAAVRRIVAAGADWRGLHIFAGSQSLGAEAIVEAQAATIDLAATIAAEAGASPPEVNLGGGFGIPYFHGDRPLDVGAIGAALGEKLRNRPQVLEETRFAIELGRWLVGEAGVYLTRIVDRKTSQGRTFLVTDGGLQHMLAASGNFGQLLRRNYPIALANRFGAEGEEEVTVTGCLCTPLDLLGDDILLPEAEPGDLIAIFCAGAYGLTASPAAFLSQPGAREVLV